MGFDPIYCDCPSLVRANFSFNCLENYYFEHDHNQCECMPQTYYDHVTSLCFPCDIGCYICVGSPSFCLVCIDSYRLILQNCFFFYKS